MSTGHLTIDLDALVANWVALDKKTNCETAAVVKADGYGLDAGRVPPVTDLNSMARRSAR